MEITDARVRTEDTKEISQCFNTVLNTALSGAITEAVFSKSQ